jgi:hypothetical protein
MNSPMPNRHRGRMNKGFQAVDVSVGWLFFMGYPNVLAGIKRTNPPYLNPKNVVGG